MVQSGVDEFVCSAGVLFLPMLSCEINTCQCGNGAGTTGLSCAAHGTDRCASCAPGYGFLNGRCTACAAGTFGPSAQMTTGCLPCSGCAGRGQEVASTCTHRTDITCRCGVGHAGSGSSCTPCTNGQDFARFPGQPVCNPCSACDAVGGLQIAACTATSNAVCTCGPGWIGRYPNCVPDVLDCHLPAYIETTALHGNRDAEVCPVGYRPVLDVTVCERAAYFLGLPDRTVDVAGEVPGAPTGCLVYGASPVFASSDTEDAQFCNGCTVACEHNNRVACQADQCSRPLFVRTNRANGNFGADDCPLGYRIVSGQKACEDAATELALGIAVDVTDDVDGAPQGCLIFGNKPVFAERDSESAEWCIGCVVVCEYNNRAACQLGLLATSTKTCDDSNGDGVEGDHYECGFGTLMSPIPTFKCAASPCSFSECCLLLTVECGTAMFAAATRDGADWGADECPTNYKAITDPTVCTSAALVLGLDDLTVDVLGAVPGAPAGCLKFGYSTEYEHDLQRALIYAESDVDNAGSCNGCIVLCEHSFRTVCESDTTYNLATCADDNGDGLMGDYFNCTSFNSDRVIKYPAPQLPCGRDCTRVDCCVSLADVCNEPVFAQSSRDGGNWGADECPEGYRPIVSPSICERAAYGLGLPDRTVDVAGEVPGAPTGCLVYGASPVFASSDTEDAQFCNGCTVACEHNYREACVTLQTVPPTCLDPNGDGVADHFVCGRGVPKQPEDLIVPCPVRHCLCLVFPLSCLPKTLPLPCFSTVLLA